MNWWLIPNFAALWIGAKSPFGSSKTFGSKPCVGCVPKTGMKVVSFWAEAIRCFLPVFLDGLWVNLSSLLCKEGWIPVNIYSGFCVGFFLIGFSFCCCVGFWFFVLFVVFGFFFLVQSAKLFPVWGADYIGVVLISVKPEICWEYSIKVNNFFFFLNKKMYLQHGALGLCLTGTCESPCLCWLLYDMLDLS